MRVSLQIAVGVAVTLRQTLSCLRRNFGQRTQGVNRDKRHLFSAFMWKTGGPSASGMATPKQVRTFRPKYSDTIRFLENER